MNTKSLLIICLLVISSAVEAQVHNAENSLKIDPATNCQIRYIYLPNLSAYFDKLDKKYIYKEKEEWKKVTEIPNLHGGYSKYSGVGVEINDYDEDEPYLYIKCHKKQFPYCSNGRFTYITVPVK
jgi:hypothetical protein